MRRSYTPEQRAEALALYEADGPSAVQHQLGIPKSTVQTWANNAGIRTRAIENATARVQRQSLDWQERRLVLAHEIGAAAEEALRLVTVSLEEAAGRNAKDFATTMAILVDKAQLLTGASTSRTTITDTREAVLTDARRTALRLVPGRAG